VYRLAVVVRVDDDKVRGISNCRGTMLIEGNYIDVLRGLRSIDWDCDLLVSKITE